MSNGKMVVFNPKKSVKIFVGEQKLSFPEFLDKMSRVNKGERVRKDFVFEENTGDKWYALFAADPDNRQKGVITAFKENTIDDSMEIIMREFGEDFLFDCRPKMIDYKKISNIEDYIIKIPHNEKSVEVNRRWLVDEIDTNSDEEFIRGLSVIELKSDISKYITKS